MSKIDLVSFWNSSGNIGMAPYVNTSADGGHIDYESVFSKVDLNTRMQSIVATLPDFFESYTIKLTDVNLSGVLVSKAECVLKTSSSSDVPDYTQILTNINTNLTNLNDKFVSDSQYGGKLGNLIFKICCALAYDVTSLQAIQNSSYLRLLIRSLSSDFTNVELGSFLNKILNSLKQSVSPHASITDVISALNATIDSKQNTTIVNNEVTPLAEINIDVPFEVKNLKKSDVENL